jgi:plasmid stability protein
MATITLKNIPEQLYQKLKQRAAQHYRSLNSEVIVCLQNVLGSKQVDPVVLLERARVLRSDISGKLTDKDLSLLKNQGRP